MRRKLIIAAALVAALPVVGLYLMSFTAARPANLGLHDGRLAPCPATPNCVCSQIAVDANRVQPLRFTDPPGAAWARLVRVVGEQPRAEVITVDDQYLHAEFTSRIFRFVDDVEFLLDAPNQVIHVRSASRVGRSDMGANRERVETIRAAFE